MSERIVVAVAWPYANGSIHLGHLAGANLPADIFAKYHRLKGNHVLMVSGSDQHGTPITLRAEQEGVNPEVIVDRYHQEFLDCWKGMGIDFDIFTTTSTINHKAVVQDIFLKLYNSGYIYKGVMKSPYCNECKRFLADRYVKGTCPHCRYEDARGDQCDQCGRTLDPKELIALSCRISKTTPVILDTEHFFLKLSAFQDKLSKWVNQQKHWRPNVLNFTKSYLKLGLKDRAITRDLEWGIPIPLDGYKNKTIYVWFEAVIGYLSATKEWAENTGVEETWEDFWLNNCKTYYFMGKDNIPFHTIIWPAMLMGYGNLNLPYDIPANEFLNLQGSQLSTSRNWAVWVLDYLKRYNPDPLRYVLAATMPERGDSDFSWDEYVRRNNDELLATYGNLVHRVLTLTYKHYDKKIPDVGKLDKVDNGLLDQAKHLLEEMSENLEHCNFKKALSTAMAMAQEANRYLEIKSPWKTVKENRTMAATTLWVSLNIINCLKVALYPYLPFTSKKIHKLLGFEGNLEDQGWYWDSSMFKPGQTLPVPEPLFVKLDEGIIQTEIENMKLEGI